MIKVPTEQGEITISDAVFTTITGAAATNCFGVKGMAQRSMTDGLVHLLRPEAMSKGVKVTYNDDHTVPSSCTSWWRTASTSPLSAAPL